MTLSLFWSRYTLGLREQHLRDVDELYHYLIARERWNWFLAKIPEQAQIQILRGHNHGEDSWTCRKWLDHMLDWIKDDMREDPQQLVARLAKLIKGSMAEGLSRFKL